MTKTLQITLVKSLIGRLPKHIKIAHQLGLKKINRTVVRYDTPSIRGMLNVIQYMVRIEEISQ